MAIVISGVNNNDKITAADGLIDILSGVSFASTITAPGFSATNNLTAASINVGSNIQIGNAGIITATTLVGNVTGNVNHTSNLLLQISGSEKLRIANSGAFGLNGTNYGSSGQVLTSQGSGSSPTWTTISSTPEDCPSKMSFAPFLTSNFCIANNRSCRDWRLYSSPMLFALACKVLISMLRRSIKLMICVGFSCCGASVCLACGCCVFGGVLIMSRLFRVFYMC